MIKKALLSLGALLALSSAGWAQNVCATDEVNRQAKALNPEIAKLEAQMEAEIQAQMKLLSVNRLAKTNGTTGQLDQKYIIPVVVHVIHDYGTEYISDDQIYRMIDHTNDLYLKRTSDSNKLIAPYSGNVPGTTNKYFAKANIEFRLANVDPLGKPSHGITRRRSVLTGNGGDQAKFDVWPPDSYINIWLIRKFNSNHDNAGAYAYKPPTGATIPYYDGIIGLASQTSGTGTYTLGHELGHVLNLDHPWGSTNQPEVDCTGSDAVDDTPPTKGHDASKGFGPCQAPAPATYPRAGGATVLATIWDTLCTQQISNVGRIIIPSPLLSAPTSTSTTEGVNFKIYSATKIRSVDVYPGPPAILGDTFTIRIVNTANAAVVASVTSTVAVLDTFQTVLMDATLQPGTYKITLPRNPGMRRGPANGSTAGYPGAIAITGADTTGGRYPFFYNIAIQFGYFKVYDRNQALALYDGILPSSYIDGDTNQVLINYPDTVNVQNVMDYAFCDFMFSHGQAVRMRAALNSTVGGRNNLWSPANLAYTGVLTPRPDLTPIADFSVNRAFLCANVASSAVTFTDRSWNDTVIASSWKFSNGATPSTSNAKNVANVQFTQPGFVTVEQTVTGNNTGDNTKVEANVVYAADANAQAPNNIEEFDGNLDKWPIFNYYPSPHKWERANVGFYDNKSVRFSNFDERNDPNFPQNVHTDAPDGLYADIYTPAYDFTGLGNSDYFLSFMTASATRSYLLSDMRDTMLVQYTTDCGVNWLTLGSLSGSSLANNGTLTIPFEPLWQGDWKGNALKMANGHPARTARTFFRFRYIAHTDNGPDFFKAGSGNNFFLDRVQINSNPLGVDDTKLSEKGFVIAPNPTHTSTSIILKGGTGLAQVSVTDMTGKVVFRTEQYLGTGASRIEVPADRISARGMYLVQVVTGNQSMTEKLVVN